MRTKMYVAKSEEEALRMACIDMGIAEDDLDAKIIDKASEDGMYNVEVITLADGIDKGKEYLQNILNHMCAKGYIEKLVKGDTVEFSVDVKDMNGMLIGKNSSHMLAIQTLLNIIVNKHYGDDEQKRVVLDVGRYRRKRASNLERMAVEYAKEVTKTKIAVRIDHLNAYERKIIHDRLSTWNEVTTHSEGEEPNRVLIIEPKQN